VNIPVIAAGGIADGKSMAAMMLLGAAGVQMGTIFLTADECPVAEIYKEKILAAADVDTIVTGRGTPHVVRALKTPMSLRYAELEKQPGNEKELETLSIGASRRAVQGDLEGGCYMAGQISGIIDRRGTCAEIIERIVAEAEETIKNAGSLLD
jgi:enoyl-[acyl-carrier protein] reductase II